MKIIENKDKQIVEYVRAQLKENEGYCPCKLIKSPENKCMCKDFRDKIESGYIGECHCGLYKSEPSVVYLCGNMEYKKDFLHWHKVFSLEGKIVIMPPFTGKKLAAGCEKILRDIHLQAMTAADLIFVVDKYGRIDDVLRKDLEDFKRRKKIIEYASETERD